MDTPDRTSPAWQLMQALRAYTETAERVIDQHGALRGVRRTDLKTLSFVISRASEGCPATPKELARRLGLTTAATTAVVDRLVEHGHARREPSTRDRRSVEIHATDSALAEGRAIFQPISAATLDSLRDFSDEELATTLRVVRAATSALESTQLD